MTIDAVALSQAALTPTMARDLLLSGLLGASVGGAGTYALHRALWKTSDQQAQRIEALAGNTPKATPPAKTSRSLAKQPTAETLERYWRQRTAQSWNEYVDSVHARLLNAPKTATQIVEDAKSAFASFGGEPEVIEVESKE